MRILNYRNFLVVLSCIFFTIPNYASCASELSSFSRQGINFSIQEDNNNIVLKVNNPNIVSANKFTLPNPARIIIDISGLKIRQSENITVNNVPYIGRIRLGSHPPYTTRLVIDLRDNSIPSYTTFLNQGLLTVTLAKAGTMINQGITNQSAINQGSTNQEITLKKPSIIKIDRINNMPSLDTQNQITNELAVTQSPSQVQNVPTLTIPVPNREQNQRPTEPIMKFEETKIIPSNVVPEKRDEIETVLPKNEVGRGSQMPSIPSDVNKDANCVLNSVSFDNDVTNSTIVKISLNRKVDFYMARTSSEIYKITLPNCKLASKNLGLPFFPSPEYKKFVFIQAKETTGGVEVSIGVEENTTLVNLQRDSQIWVKSKN